MTDELIFKFPVRKKLDDRLGKSTAIALMETEYEQCFQKALLWHGYHGYLKAFKTMSDAVDYAVEFCELGLVNAPYLDAWLLLEFCWGDPRIATLHICTFNKDINWINYFNSELKPLLFEHVDELRAYISVDNKGIVHLATKIGFEFVLDQSGHEYYGVLKYGKSKKTR